MVQQPQLGVCYYPEHWPESMWQEDAQAMIETGLRWVRIGEFSWSRLEPQEGDFHWQWLDRAIAVLAQAGLKVVLGTPSTTPPQWVVQKFPDMLAVDANNKMRTFGSRRHYCFSHLGYRAQAASMAAAMAQRYGKNPQVCAWQVDNEYGCHDSTLSYSPQALQEFRKWLVDKYQTIQALNDAWGNVFWSMEYTHFTDIDLPHLTVTEANPSHVLDFRRFSSDMVIAFNKLQVDAMRPHTQAPLIHNYMGRITEFDHFALAQDLEIASWDSYPLGFLEDIIEADDDWKARFYRQGDPDFQAFHHDLYRAVGQGRWWIMEQQPGPVNWASWNPIPLDGMVRLWTWEAIAHGAEVVSYFRWRQAPFAQEQMHAGLLRSDNVKARGSIEAQQVAQELAEIGDIRHKEAEVAIVFDYQSQWVWQTQPQGQDFDYFRLVFEMYRALRRLGLSVDILPANCSDFGARKCVLIPALMHWNEQIRQAIKNFQGSVIIGPRTGAKTADMQAQVPPDLDMIDVVVSRVASLPPSATMALEKGGHVIRWFEQVEASQILEQTLTGEAVVVGDQQRAYLAAWLDEVAMKRVLSNFVQAAGIEVKDMPEGVRRRETDSHTWIFNYNAEAVTVDSIVIEAADFHLLTHLNTAIPAKC